MTVAEIMNRWRAIGADWERARERWRFVEVCHTKSVSPR